MSQFLHNFSIIIVVVMMSWLARAQFDRIRLLWGAGEDMGFFATVFLQILFIVALINLGLEF